MAVGGDRASTQASYVEDFAALSPQSQARIAHLVAALRQAEARQQMLPLLRRAPVDPLAEDRRGPTATRPILHLITVSASADDRTP